MSTPIRPEAFDSLFVDAGLPIHAAAWGSGEPTYVLVHGLGGSHVNWMLAGGALARGSALARGGRVLALDLPGFGRTDPRGPVSLPLMQAALDRFIAATCKGPIVLVGHSMGGAVAVLQAAARPTTVRALVLVAPALPLESGGRLRPETVLRMLAWMTPFLGPRLIARRAAEIGPEGTVRDLMSVTVKDLARVPKEVFDAHVELARTRPQRPWIDAGLSQATRSLVGQMTRRWSIHRAMQSITAPTLVVQGKDDGLVPLATARGAIRRCPTWRLEVIDDIAHAPPLEAPDRFVEIVRQFVDGLPARQ